MNGEAPAGVGVVERILERLRDTMTVERVFGEPIERGNVTVVPVAAIRSGGGGGGGGGQEEGSSGSGEGGGFGAIARPVGVYVLADGTVRWKPAYDWTRMFVIGNLTAVAYFLFARLSRRK